MDNVKRQKKPRRGLEITLSETERAVIDAARGSTPRAAWIRARALAAAFQVLSLKSSIADVTKVPA